MKKNYILLNFLILTTLCFSQNKITFSDSEAIDKEISTFAEKKEYDKVIEIIDKVSKNDSTYTERLITKSYYLLQLEKFKEAIEVTEEGLKISDSNHRFSFYLNKALAYWYSDEKEEALKIIDTALIEFPYNYKLYYQKGWFYHNMDKYKEALEMYKRSLVLNPFYANTHLKLGNICYKQHLITQALMCFDTYLLLNPDGDGAFEVLKSLNSVLAKKNENKKITRLTISKDDEAFEDIDLILDNRVALNSDYKIDNEITIDFTKQNHALFQTINTFKGNGGFWDTKYVELYKWIANNNHFDDFVYTTTFSIKNEKFKKIVDKKRDDVIAFVLLFKDKWAEIMGKNELLFNGKKQPVSLYFNNYKIEGIGIKKGDSSLEEYWESVDSKGRLSAKGNFDANEKKIGNWIWYYPNGNTKETAHYIKGKLNGKNIGYYKNGTINYKATYIEGQLNGTYSYFNNKGALTEYKTFKNGKLNGTYHSYYNVGKTTPNFIVNYKEGSKEGGVIQYYANGEKRFETTFKNDLKHGKEKNYYNSGVLESQYYFTEGKLSKEYLGYYKDSTLLKKGTYLAGKFSGIWQTYYPNDILKEKYNYIKGKLNGSYLEYTSNGKLSSDFTYRNDELIAYKFYNLSQKIIKDVHKKGGEFFYEGYSINGIKLTEGLYDVKGGKTGEWKFYTKNGVLASKATYNENLIQGDYINYYNNDSIKSIENHVNDTITGYYVDYFGNGKIKAQGWYKKGKAQKEWRYYYKNGTLKSINYFHNGTLHGEQQYFSIEGKLYLVSTYKYDKIINEKNYDYKGDFIDEISYSNLEKDAALITHHVNKKNKYEFTYKFGIKHGAYKEYDFYGNLIAKGNYINNEASGKWTWYYKNNTIKKEAFLLKGQYHGTVLYYYENGNLEYKHHYTLGDAIDTDYFYAEDGKTIIRKEPYLNGKLHGRRISYSQEGKLQLIRLYEFGKLIGYSYLDKNAKEIPIIAIKNETAKIVSFFNNGKKAFEIEYNNGDTENEFRTYYYSGQLDKKYFSKNGDLDGIYTLYYKNGKIKEEINYENDERNGFSKKYYANGQLKEEIPYINNEKSGEAHFYSKTGTLKKTEKYFNDYIYETTQ